MASCPKDLHTHAVNAPRDVKQVANTQFQRRLKSNLSSKGLLNLMTSTIGRITPSMMLSLYQFLQYYNAEIIRGRYNYGQHRILPELAHVDKEENDKPIPPKMVDPKTIIQTIKDAEKDVNAHFKKC
ncbi:hypothetical protein DAPPUDRAFT_333229 [Daphnia pulex]|uniref:Uncharacterized protein n=1 Tax=Daphnia pulex TaxID=6669 RepID=E9HS96_DAPPU|nr:hypothetical protein DAPPUDRAFT_333229 [Daphnia pulex]|eukprot:EFX65370.1 hypothetical protein DAPPUDRAFT_333229 [Daphnia pulex]